MAPNKKNPQEDIRSLSAVINSGEFKNVHLLCGGEAYLRNQFRDKLVKALGGDESSMSYDKLVGKDVVAEQVIDLAETMPFFSPRRVILIEDTGWIKSGGDVMAEYISQGICETTYIVFCESEVDKRSKLYKAISSAGMVSEFGTQDEQTLSSWAAKRIKDAGLNISGGDIRYLLNIVGSDMTNVSNEIEKLICFCLNKGTVSRNDIDTICARRLEDKIFQMCDAIALRRQRDAFGMYFDLMAMRESPYKILVMVTRHYNLLLQIKDMELDRKPDSVIGPAVGKQDWTIKNYRAQTSHYTIDELKTIVNKCVELDMNIKTGNIAEGVGVETLLVDLLQKVQ